MEVDPQLNIGPDFTTPEKMEIEGNVQHDKLKKIRNKIPVGGERPARMKEASQLKKPSAGDVRAGARTAWKSSNVSKKSLRAETSDVDTMQVEAVSKKRSREEEPEKKISSGEKSRISAAKIFEIESQMRETLEEAPPSKKVKLQHTYEQKILPLAAQAKQSIVEHPHQLPVYAAAAKGKAAHVWSEALKNLTENQPVIEKSGDSAQEVFLLPEEKLVLKRSSDRAEEEERNVNDLLDLMSKQAIVGTFSVQKSSRADFGIQIPQEVKERGYLEEDLDPKLREGIKQKLLYEDKLILDYYASAKDDSQKLYLIPYLQNADDKANYQFCEQFKWSFKDAKGKRQEGDFKMLHSAVLQNLQLSDVQCIPNKPGQQLPTQQETLKAVHVWWKVVSPQLMQLKEGVISPLNDIQAKPFISEMILMKDLYSSREAVLKRLTPDSEFNAILIGEVQLLDLHGGNLGVMPEPNDAYDRFKDLKFSTGAKPQNFYDRIMDLRFSTGEKSQNFNELIMDYLAGRIGKTTLITYTEDGETITKPLQDLPELQKALDVRWQFVIFDTDLSLSEDNRLQLQIRDGKEEHLIPFRSVLLTTEWNNEPLSEVVLQRLEESTDRDLRVKSWIKKADAPIYKHMSLEARERVKQLATPFVEKYDLSGPRKDKKGVTIKDLRNSFVKEISQIDPSTSALWRAIEGDLSNVIVYSSDTWETIAKRHRQDINELQRLNPNGFKSGEKVKINYDVTSSSAEAIRKREVISAQLFPRITYRQQQALLERQQHRAEYLSSYRELAESKLEGQGLLDQIEKFIRKRATPLSSIRKEDLLKELSAQRYLFLKNPGQMANFKQKICNECQPTHCNLMKAMYPLLADAYALNQAVYGNNASAGANIGLYCVPLEVTIGRAQWQFSMDSPESRLATNLRNQIASITDPAFFGNWDRG